MWGAGTTTAVSPVSSSSSASIMMENPLGVTGVDTSRSGGTATSDATIVSQPTMRRVLYPVIGKDKGGYDEERLAMWPPLAIVPSGRGHHPAWSQVSWWAVARFRILLFTMPLAAGVTVVRFLLIYFKYQVAIADSTILPPLVAACAFILANVLTNVLSDYKESEKIPSDLTSYFASLTFFATSEGASLHFDPRPLLQQVEGMLLCVISTLDRKVPFQRALTAFNHAHVNYIRLAHKAGARSLEGVEHDVTEVVRKWTRIYDISRTSILLAAYTVMDALTIFMVALLACVQYEKEKTSDNSGYWACAIFSSIVIYLNMLVRELDDPFAGPPGYLFECYICGAAQVIPITHGFSSIATINFDALVVDFGSFLRELIHGERPSYNNLAYKAGPLTHGGHGHGGHGHGGHSREHGHGGGSEGGGEHGHNL